jgi:hypothetical protein
VLRYSIRLSVMAIALSAGFVNAATDPQERLFAIEGVVVDESGARITHAQVVFKGESGTIVAHTGMDGSVNVNVAAGKYVATVSALGFVTTKLVDFSVPSPTADAFRVVLQVSQVRFGSGPDPGFLAPVATIQSELPDAIKDEPNRTSSPVVQPAATKQRSARCLYLWRCSVSQP